MRHGLAAEERRRAGLSRTAEAGGHGRGPTDARRAASAGNGAAGR